MHFIPEKCIHINPQYKYIKCKLYINETRFPLNKKNFFYNFNKKISKKTTYTSYNYCIRSLKGKINMFVNQYSLNHHLSNKILLKNNQFLYLMSFLYMFLFTKTL